MELSLFASTARGLEGPLLQELRDLGAGGLRPGQSGVTFRGDLAMAMRVCLWSRVAGRLLYPLGRLPAADTEQLHASVLDLPWEDHLAPGGSMAVDFSGTNPAFRNTRFGAQRVKDGVVDRFRNLGLARPAIDLERPALRIHVKLQGEWARVSLDLSGSGLHRRGWRLAPGEAQMRETLAAGILYLCGWPEIARAGGGFVDLMCGSGTLPIEAAWLAGDVAPGLSRDYFGFLRLPWFDAAAWERLLAEARQRAADGLSRLPPLFAWDADAAALASARRNAEAAGLGGRIRFERIALEDPGFSAAWKGVNPPGTGLVLANPPYGQRLGDEDALLTLYQGLGGRLRADFAGWRGAVFTGGSGFSAAMGMRPGREHALFNGPLACQLWIYENLRSQPGPGSGAAGHFANRLRKNLRQLSGWAQREGIACYRLYDADMPEYAAAVDLYGQWAHVQEYQAPGTIAPDQARARFDEIVAGVSAVLSLPRERIFVKVRKPQKGRDQYEKLGGEAAFVTVAEGGLNFLVNLQSYLDSGLFLDHRLLRARIGDLAAGGRFLNLFGYTGTATVYAAAGGATETVTVDISRTYLEWAERNLALNGFSTSRNRLVQEDCLAWLRGERSRYDLILLAPPTFSNSKRMSGDLDLIRDHGTLLALCNALLAPGGTLLFSVHARRFQLDPGAVPEGLACRETTRQTVPRDFQRRPAFHRSWEMRRQG